MKSLGLRNSLGKAFSDNVKGSTFAEGDYNCTVFLFNEEFPTDINKIRDFAGGYQSRFNYELVKDCVGMFNARFYYDPVKDKFTLSNTTDASENQSSSVRKIDQYAPAGINCLLIPTLSTTSMVTPTATTLATNTLWYAPSIMKRGVSGVVPTDIENTDSFFAHTQLENFMYPRLGSTRSLKSLASLAYGNDWGHSSYSTRLILKYSETKTLNKLLFRVHGHVRVDACQVRIHAKIGNNAYSLISEFRFNPSAAMVGNYVEINLPEFTADIVQIAGLWVSGGVNQGNPGWINLSEIAFGQSDQNVTQNVTIPQLNANFGIVAFGTKDYSVRMNDANGRFPQTNIPMFALPVGTAINQLDVNLNNTSNYLRLNKNVEI